MKRLIKNIEAKVKDRGKDDEILNHINCQLQNK